MENEDVKVEEKKPQLTPMQKKIIHKIVYMEYKKRLKNLGVI